LAKAGDDRSHSAACHRGLITVFGGTGFLGRRIVRHLLDHGFQMRTASRHPERLASASRSDARPETTTAVILDETSVAAALFGAYGVVNARPPFQCAFKHQMGITPAQWCRTHGRPAELVGAVGRRMQKG